MRWIDDAVTEFGKQLGITGLNLGRHGNAQLELGSGALLTVEPVRRGRQDEVLVSLGRPVGHQLPRLNRLALSKAHHSRGGALPIQVASRGQGTDAMLLAVVRLPQRGFTPQALAHAADYLGRWLDAVAAGSTS